MERRKAPGFDAAYNEFLAIRANCCNVCKGGQESFKISKEKKNEGLSEPFIRSVKNMRMRMVSKGFTIQKYINVRGKLQNNKAPGALSNHQ